MVGRADAGEQLELELAGAELASDADAGAGAACERLRPGAAVKAPDELEQLALQADALGDAPAPGATGPGPEQAPAESPNIGLIALALTAFREASCLMLQIESPRVTLADAQISSCAAVLAPVADKYGIDLSMQFGPEAAAAMVAGPILWNAYSQASHELKARKAKPAKGVEEITPDQADQAATPASSSSSSAE
jgi:hypothetical protein